MGVLFKTTLYQKREKKPNLCICAKTKTDFGLGFFLIHVGYKRRVKFYVETEQEQKQKMFKAAIVMVIASLSVSTQMATAASKHSKRQLPSNFASIFNTPFFKNAGKVNPAAGGMSQLSTGMKQLAQGMRSVRNMRSRFINRGLIINKSNGIER
jgi:X-X-X-Leu-X-X-Gly heptad repeat protein